MTSYARMRRIGCTNVRVHFRSSLSDGCAGQVSYWNRGVPIAYEMMGE